ncbi:MAG TPA: hypothetical protein VMF89_25145, partial [Polyangiales bacterium]|nr:hypothetical protein [Polyangiales bacterium]
GYPAVRSDLLPAESALQEEFKAGHQAEFWTRMNEVVPAHPAQASLACLAGAQRVREGQTDAPFWLNRAMLLAPNWGLPHLWTAWWLGSIGRTDQATTELQLAAESAPGEASELLAAWLSKDPRAELALRSVPDRGPNRVFVLDVAAARLFMVAPTEGEIVDAYILRESPYHASAGVREITRLMRAQRLKEASQRAQALQLRHPRRSQLYLLQADSLKASGDAEAAVRVLRSTPPDVDDRRAVLRALSLAYVSLGDAKTMREVVANLSAESAGDPAKLADALVLLGSNEALLGNSARAMKAVREAHLLGAGASALASSAELAEQLGHEDYALSVWTQLCGELADDPYYCSHRDALLRRVNP